MIKPVSAQQANVNNKQKNTKLKLLETNTTKWFKEVNVLNYNFSKEQYTFPDDDRNM